MAGLAGTSRGTSEGGSVSASSPYRRSALYAMTRTYQRVSRVRFRMVYSAAAPPSWMCVPMGILVIASLLNAREVSHSTLYCRIVSPPSKSGGPQRTLSASWETT